MTRRARVRKLAKWTSTMFTLLLLLTWVVSGWFSVVHISIVPGTFDDKRYCGISRGQFEHIRLSLSGETSPGEPGWHLGMESNPVWRIGYELRYASSLPNSAIVVPLWIPLAAIAALTLALVRRDLRAVRRMQGGRCTICGYDLAATAMDAPCPECGKVRAA